MNIAELQRAMGQLRLGGMAAVLEIRDHKRRSNGQPYPG
jgi:hypothetical protein